MEGQNKTIYLKLIPDLTQVSIACIDMRDLNSVAKNRKTLMRIKEKLMTILDVIYLSYCC